MLEGADCQNIGQVLEHSLREPVALWGAALNFPNPLPVGLTQSV